MISFEPLRRLMKERNITVTGLAELVGKKNSQISAVLNYRVVPSTVFVHSVCSTLSCGISDVIEYREGETVRDRLIKVRWDVLEGLCGEVGLSLYRLSLMAGRGKSVLSEARNRNGRMMLSTAERISEILGCRLSDICEVEDEKETD